MTFYEIEENQTVAVHYFATMSTTRGVSAPIFAVEEVVLEVETQILNESGISIERGHGFTDKEHWSNLHRE